MTTTTTSLEVDRPAATAGERVTFTARVDPPTAPGTVVLELERGGWLPGAPVPLVDGVAVLEWVASTTSTFRASYLPASGSSSPGAYPSTYTATY